MVPYTGALAHPQTNLGIVISHVKWAGERERGKHIERDRRESSFKTKRTKLPMSFLRPHTMTPVSPKWYTALADYALFFLINALTMRQRQRLSLSPWCCGTENPDFLGLRLLCASRAWLLEKKARWMSLRTELLRDMFGVNEKLA